MNWKLLITAIVIIIAIIAAYTWQQQRQRESVAPSLVVIEEEQPMPVVDEPVVEEPPPQADDELPETTQPAVETLEERAQQEGWVPPPNEVDGSDPQVNLAIKAIDPDFLRWLIPPEQIRKWVLTIDLAAEGKLPTRYLPLDYPMPPFKVIEQDGEIVADPANYERFDNLINQLTSIASQQLADYYRYWQPIFDQAYGELDKPGTFDQRLHLAIQQVLAVEPLTAPNELVRPKVLYQYADPALQQANDVTHLMWRMGTDNTVQLQDYLRELQQALTNSE